MLLQHRRKWVDVDGSQRSSMEVGGVPEWRERVATLITQWRDVDWLSSSNGLNILQVDIYIYSDLPDWGESGQTERIDRTVTVAVTLQALSSGYQFCKAASILQFWWANWYILVMWAFFLDFPPLDNLNSQNWNHSDCSTQTRFFSVFIEFYGKNLQW